MTYWPFTSTVKSEGNAFSWRGQESIFFGDRWNHDYKTSVGVTATIQAKLAGRHAQTPEERRAKDRARKKAQRLAGRGKGHKPNEFTKAKTGPRKY